jgi:hypothetical protein
MSPVEGASVQHVDQRLLVYGSDSGDEALLETTPHFVEGMNRPVASSKALLNLVPRTGSIRTD